MGNGLRFLISSNNQQSRQSEHSIVIKEGLWVLDQRTQSLMNCRNHLVILRPISLLSLLRYRFLNYNIHIVSVNVIMCIQKFKLYFNFIVLIMYVFFFIAIIYSMYYCCLIFRSFVLCSIVFAILLSISIRSFIVKMVLSIEIINKYKCVKRIHFQ